MDISNLTMEELLELKKKIDDSIKEKKEVEKQKAIEEVKSLLERVNALQEKYEIEIEAFDKYEDYCGSISDLSVCD